MYFVVKNTFKLQTDVQAGDYFFLCTDGVLESVNDEQLCSIISKNNTAEEMMQAINDLCQEHSRDNFSAYLIPVIEGIKATIEDSITVPPKRQVPISASISTPEKKKSKKRYLILIFIALVLIALGTYYLWTWQNLQYLIEKKQAKKSGGQAMKNGIQVMKSGGCLNQDLVFIDFSSV